MDALPPGSYLVIADGVAASEEASSAQRGYNQSAREPYQLRTPGRLASFFDGLDLVAPGVVPCPQWKPDTPAGDGPPEAAAAYCGVARKP